MTVNHSLKSTHTPNTVNTHPQKHDPVETLPVLDAMVKRSLSELGPHPLEKTLIVYVHHPLFSSINLLEAIITLGAKTENIFVLGKHYSECKAVVEHIINRGVYYQRCSTQKRLGGFSDAFTHDIKELWSNVTEKMKEKNDIEQILILDHGGYALQHTPAELIPKYKIIGIEKTTAGLINFNSQHLPPFPLIGVANCATKKYLESPLIAEAVVHKLLPFIPLKNARLICGVVGYGSIGKAVSNKLFEMGHEIIVYDHNPNQLQRMNDADHLTKASNLSTLITSADCIFGCSGQDVTESTEIFIRSNQNKTLISCSSEDKEFLSLLNHIQKNNNSVVNPLEAIDYTNERGAILSILRGGFPVNFDHSGESVPANDIQLTRALVLGGVLQALRFFSDSSLAPTAGLYALDPILQKNIVDDWFPYQPAERFPKNMIENFQNLEWIKQHSLGTHHLL